MFYSKIGKTKELYEQKYNCIANITLKCKKMTTKQKKSSSGFFNRYELRGSMMTAGIIFDIIDDLA
jgi:hypothetical protein